ncbi:hypothetical protein L6164_000971 [Bauhinia variegata]|uniref:Uncharacterized protein n=1 Tax=Bauhinia variegata TaxID=167791 RepID=A0ACB9Q846_BAUVA|nr:hypothetical protein L6164_000971 [Bauhinia variegata]
MEFLAVAVDKLWKYTVEPVARQVGYVIFYHRDVLDWLKQVDDMVPKADVLNNNKRHANAACSGRSIPNLLLRHKLSRRSKKMKEEIVKIKTKGNFNSVSYRVPKLRAPSLITHGEQFGSRISVFNDIMEALKDPNLQTIGLYGLGGVGKTTLVKEVAEKAREEKLFDVVVLARVTQNPNIEEIQNEVADKFGLKLAETKLKLYEIGIPSIKQHKGLKFLMTSRNRELLSNRMNTQRDFCLQALTKEEGWKLFVDKAQFDESSVNKELFSIATEIAKKCDGLPVAIVTIASSLKKKDFPPWSDALQRLRNPSPTYTTSVEASIYNVIEVSYENLENDLLWSIFLLCAEMASIFSIDDLFKISFGLAIFLESKHQYLFMKRYEELQEWPGNDQLQNCKTIILQKRKIDELPEELDCPNLAFFHLDSGDSYLKMPENFFKGMCGLKVLTLVGRRLKSLPLSFSLLSNLCTLHLKASLDSEDIAIIGQLKGLKVLTLELHIQQLPRELRQLTQLQLLDLKGCQYLEMIPPNVFSSFSKLVELYLPDLIRWYIDDPNNQKCNASLAELNDLTRLITLEIFIPDQRMLPKELVLERLQRYHITIGRDFLGMSPIRSRMFRNTSRKLELNLSTSIHLWEYVRRLLDNVEILLLEHLKGAKNVVPEINVQGMPQLKEFTLSSSQEMQTIVESSGLKHANAIDIFPNLEQLRIEHMTNLIRLWDGSLAGKSFSRLKCISVNDCPLMKSLFSASTVIEEIVPDDDKVLNFPQLRFLSLRGLPELISFWNERETYSSAQSMQFSSDMGDNNSFTHTALFDDKVIFPSLEEITISNAFKLNTIWHCQRQLRSNSFDKLKKLEIESCSKLRYLFPASVAKNLCKLQKLEVKRCHMMEDIIMKDDNTNPSSSDDKVLFPNLEELIITHMDKLNRICCWNQQLLYPNSFGRLRKVAITKCPELISIFPCYKISTTESLQKLTIVDCKSLEQIFDLQGETSALPAAVKQQQATELSGFPNLEEMQVRGCERLRYLFPAFVARSLGKIRKLTIGKCLNMEEIIMAEDNNHHSFNNEVVFPNLEEMIICDMDKLNTIWGMQQRLASNSFGRLEYIEIRNCPGFVSIFPCYVISMIQSLKNITVEGCGELKNLLPATVAKRLSKLQALRIERCPMMEVLITDDNTNQSSIDEVVFPNLEQMFIIDMPNLNTICDLSLQLPANSFGRLEQIRIRNCEGFSKGLPRSLLKSLNNLQVLELQSCNSLRQVFDLEEETDVHDDQTPRVPESSLEVLILDSQAIME